MATKKITQLTVDTSVTGPDVMPIVSDNVTKKVTLTTLASFFSVTGPTGVTGAASTVTGPTGVGEHYHTDTQPAAAANGATWFAPTSGHFHIRSNGLWYQVGATGP